MAKTLPQTRIPVSDPRRGFDAIGPEFGATIERVIGSGRYIHGPEHAAFEEELAGFLGVSHCAGVASGTDALELALAAVGCTLGDEVVTAANAGGYTTAAASRLGCPVRYADVDPDDARAHRRHGRAGADGCHSGRRRHSPLRTDVRRRGDRRALPQPRHRCRRGLRAGGRSGARRATGRILRRRGSAQLLPDEESRRDGRRRRRGHGRCRNRRARPRAAPVRLVGEVPCRCSGRLRTPASTSSRRPSSASGSRISTDGTNAGGRSSAATRRRSRRTPAASSGATAKTSWVIWR